MNTNSIVYILPRYQAVIRDNPAIFTKQIQLTERLKYFNNILYLQVYRVKRVILTEMWCNELESFAPFPDYIARFNTADRTYIVYISTLSNGTFKGVFSALDATRMQEPTSKAL